MKDFEAYYEIGRGYQLYEVPTDKENRQIGVLRKWFKELIDGQSKSKKEIFIAEFSEYYDK